MSELTITSRKIRKENHIRLSLAGSLEAADANQFWEKVNAAIQKRPGARVTIDMTNLLFMASCGWALLLVGAHAASAQQGALVLAGMIPAVERVYQRLNLSQYLALAD